MKANLCDMVHGLKDFVEAGLPAQLRLIEAERKQSAGVCVEAPQFTAETCAVGIANGFRDEILGVYERQLKRDDLPA